MPLGSRRIALALLATLSVACGGNGQDANAAPEMDGGSDATVPTPDASGGDTPIGDAGESSKADSSHDAAATCPPAPLATSLLPLVDAITAAMSAHGGANSNATSIPATSDRDAFAASVVSTLSGDFAAACALPASYRLVSFADGADTLLVVAELDASGTPSPSLFWGTYVARAGAGFARVVVEAPHPVFDAHTEHEAADVFLHVHGSALLVAGSHRCANALTSGCSGTTTACDTTASPYRISDAAHSVALPFAAIHDALSTTSTAPFLQLHGNSAACPDALVSDGSGAWSDAGIAATLAHALEANGATVGRCGAGYPTTGCNLCGTDNVEGRFTAGASDACTKTGSAYGRFIHVEQLPGLRATPDGGAGGYAPMLAAAMTAFP